MTTFIGLAAAFFTTISYFPQLMKVWRTGQTNDLSIRMLLALLAGLALWIVYGILQSDIVIVLANAISFCLVGVVARFKIREMRGAR